MYYIKLKNDLLARKSNNELYKFKTSDEAYMCIADSNFGECEVVFFDSEEEAETTDETEELNDILQSENVSTEQSDGLSEKMKILAEGKSEELAEAKAWAAHYKDELMRMDAKEKELKDWSERLREKEKGLSIIDQDQEKTKTFLNSWEASLLLKESELSKLDEKPSEKETYTGKKTEKAKGKK